MKYVLHYNGKEAIVGIGTYSEKFGLTWEDDIIVDIPIIFKGKSICENNWEDIKQYIKNELKLDFITY